MDKAMLKSYLDAQRKHLLGILDGLDEETLRRPVLPTGWSCLGMVHHLTLDVEQFWFLGAWAGEPAAIEPREGDGWTVPPELTAEAVLAGYRDTVKRADEVIDRLPLDAEPVWWPDFFGDWRMKDLGQAMLHVITETATHAGHLDAVRELIDGRTWLVLP